MGGKVATTGTTFFSGSDQYTAEGAFAQAEHYRIEVGDFDYAISFYNRCLTLLPTEGHNQLRFACWAGLLICYGHSGKYSQADFAFNRAHHFCQSDIDYARICRDWAKVLMRLGHYGTAESRLTEALHILEREQQWAEYYATVHYYGLLRLAQGQLMKAFEDFMMADRNLHRLNAPFWGNQAIREPENGNCYYELYNKLYLIHAYSRLEIRSWVGFKRICDEADILAHNFGAPAHRVRVMVLRYGGWRADDYFRDHRDQWLRLAKSGHWLMRMARATYHKSRTRL